MVDIAFAFCHGFSVRLVLHSGVVEELQRRGLRVAILLPKVDQTEVTRLRERYGVEVLEVPKPNRLASQHLEMLRRYLFEDVRGNPALRARHERIMAGPMSIAKVRASLFYVLNRITHLIPSLRSGLERAQRGLYRNAEIRETIKELSPHLVVSTYPANPIEAVILAESARLGITTVNQLLSWDNITAKGRFTILADKFVSWGPIMSGEIEGHYGVDDSNIAEVGVPHFEVHKNAATPEGVETELRRLGLPPDQPYIFFGMSASFFAPREIDIVEAIAARVNSDGFGDDMHLVVRPHPQNLTGLMSAGDWVSRLEALKGHRVAINYPSMVEGSLPWMMKEDDLVSLGNLLSGAAVTLNSGSTLSIDAMIHDRPVVITAFDADDEFRWWESGSRGIMFTHNAKLAALKGLRVAHSFEELWTQMNAYIENPELDSEGRETSRRLQCGPIDGKSVSRTADALEEWVKESDRQ